MRFYVLILFAVLVSVTTKAQPYLKPSIGLSSLPADNAPICTIPVYQGSFDTSGYAVGDTIPDFTLYTVNGAAVNMATVLQGNKPALLIAGSYTCPVFRGKMADINAMAAFYGSALNIYIIYTVEAHPSPTPSPYSGTLWVTSQNQTAGILFPQPTTYGQRKAMVDTMNAHMSFTPTILIDGPCNEWWSHFGPAPNNAYLIDATGKVRAKNGWYDKLPDNMWCSIDTLLGTTSGHCSAVAGNGNFSFKLVQDSLVSGPAGAVLSIHGMLKNMSNSATATVNIQKLQKNLPSGWLTALCTDICLSTSVEQTQVIIPPADSQSFTFYFYTDNIAAAGNVQVGFSNPNNNNNKMKQGFYASTWSLGVNVTYQESIGENQLLMYPNPARDILSATTVKQGELDRIELYDLQGKLVNNSDGFKSNVVAISVAHLRPGMYFVRAYSGKIVMHSKILIL